MTTPAETEFEISEKIKSIGFDARRAWLELANLSEVRRNAVLAAIADQLQSEKDILLAANQFDIEQGRAAGLSEAMIDRLTLTPKRFEGLLESLQQIQALPDPLSRVLESSERPNGLKISKISVPIGVIALVYESRPNVTIEAAALAIKSGNAIILKGGKEAFKTNSTLAECITEALKQKGLPEACVTLIPFKERQATLELLKQKETIDLVIPRGGEGLIEFVVENSRIPVIKHYKGICHTYIDRTADYRKAVAISVNAKAQRPGVCNAMETLLVHKGIAPAILPTLIKAMQEAGVEIRACEQTRTIDPSLKSATEEDWKTEYLDKILSVKIVDSLDAAMEHIEKYGSRHSDAIITEDKVAAAHFIQNVDATAVFVNTSTRFNDGFEFGLGAEMGISTDKLHARGPMGLREMTTYKYVVLGDGQVRG